MMKKWIIGCIAVLVLAGCKTTQTETTPISWHRQQAYLKRLRDPRVYGMSIFNTAEGTQIRDAQRLHPNQVLAMPMLVEEPFRPAVLLAETFGDEYPVLLDPGSSQTVFEFTTAQALGAEALGEREPSLIRLPDEEVAACLSVLSSLQFGQLYIENSLLYVRLADGSLGSSARGIIEPELKGVVGWSSLKKFEQIRFLYSAGQVLLLTTEPYDPDPSQVIATLPIIQGAKMCVVRATLDGVETPVLFDPAGDFEVATDGAAPVKSLRLGDGLIVDAPVVSESPGGSRLGARFLQKYDVTLCPKKGVIYLEPPMVEKK